jgi:hypothetical protein
MGLELPHAARLEQGACLGSAAVFHVSSARKWSEKRTAGKARLEGRGNCHWILYKAAGHDQQVLTGWRFVAAVTGLIAAIALSIHLLFDLVERRRRVDDRAGRSPDPKV